MSKVRPNPSVPLHCNLFTCCNAPKSLQSKCGKFLKDKLIYFWQRQVLLLSFSKISNNLSSKDISVSDFNLCHGPSTFIQHFLPYLCRISIQITSSKIRFHWLQLDENIITGSIDSTWMSIDDVSDGLGEGMCDEDGVEAVGVNRTEDDAWESSPFTEPQNLLLFYSPLWSQTFQLMTGLSRSPLNNASCCTVIYWPCLDLLCKWLAVLH